MSEAKLEWKPVVYEISQALVLEDGYREALGVALVDRLEIYGEFYDRLFNERKVDRELHTRQIEQSQPETAATYASVTLGGLTLIAKRPGTLGNSIVIEVSSGAGTNFQVPAVDETANAMLQTAAHTALNGGAPIALSENEAIAQIQVDAQAYLASIDDETRSQASDLLDRNWPRYSTASTGLDYNFAREEIIRTINTIQAEDGTLISEDVKAGSISFPDRVGVPGIPDGVEFPEEAKVSPIAFYDDRVAQLEAATANVFGMAVIRGNTRESVLEVVPGYSINVSNSNLIGSAAWDGDERPANGSYQMSGGIDASSAKAGKISSKPDGAYVVTLDSRRSFSLIELEQIVSSTLYTADQWLHSP